MRHNDENNKRTGRISFLGILLAIFIGLKLAKVIDWSWWIVLIPLWIELAIIFIAVLVAAIIILVIEWYDNNRWRF